MANEASLVNTPAIVEQATRELHLGSSFDEIQRNLIVVHRPGTTLIDVSAEDRQPRVATAIANTLAADFVADQNSVQKQRIALSLEPMKSQIGELDQQIATEAGEIALLRATPALTADQQGRLQYLQQRYVLDSARYSAMLKNYDAIRMARVSSPDPFAVAARAIPPGSAVRPKRIQNATVGALIGVTIGVSVVMFRRRRQPWLAIDDIG